MSEELTDEDRARIERNRQNAVLLRSKKQAKMSTAECDAFVNRQTEAKKQSNLGQGGFLRVDQTAQTSKSPSRKRPSSPAPMVMEANQASTCIECNRSFLDSYLKLHFDYLVCDVCRDPEDKHTLITRTQAKSQYLLKDCDLDLREPVLRFLAKRTKSEKYNKDMKLYLQLQVEQRAMSIWGSEQAILDEMERREAKSMEQKSKKYHRELLALRRQMGASKKRTVENHEHDYGDEIYLENEDKYSKTCKTCGNILEYEKL